MIREICTFTDEVTQGEILDVVKLYQAVHDPHSPEANAEYILNLTYPTDALRQFVEFVASKLNRQRDKGVCLAMGGYGSGKSHACLVLYHLVQLGDQASQWTAKWNIKASFPSGTRAAAVNLVSETVSNIWEPLFQRVGCSDLIAQVTEWPSVGLWRQLASKGPVLLLIDELEDWLDSVPEETRRRNQRALYTLAEAANDTRVPLAVVLVVYGRKPHLYQDALREQPPPYDFSETRGREHIVLHRLIKSRKDSEVRAVVDKYIQAYAAVSDQLPSIRAAWDDYRRKMLEFYPFHPHFLTSAFSIYGSASHHQGARGVIYLASTLLRECLHRDWDILTVGMVSPLIDPVALDLRQLNITLTDRASEDLRLRLSGQEEAEPVISTALFFSFTPERTGATFEDMCLAFLGPTRNLNDLEVAIRAVEERAWHFGRDGRGRYRILEEPVLRKVIEQQARELLGTPQGLQNVRGVFKQEMKAILGQDACALDEVRDEERPVRLVFATRPLSLDMVRETVRGWNWPNTVVFIGPKPGLDDLLEDEGFLMTVARVVVAKSLQIDPEGEEELRRLETSLREQLEKVLKERYGRWLKVVRIKEPSGVRYASREIDIELSGDRIWTELRRHYDQTAVKEAIREYLEEQGDKGAAVREIGEAFKRLQGFPILREDSEWQAVFRQMVNETGEVVVEAGKALYPYQGQLPQVLQEDWRAWLKQYAPPPPPPPGLRDAIVRHLRQARNVGVSLDTLLERVRAEGVEGATPEAFRRTMADLVDAKEAVVEDQEGQVRCPEGGAFPKDRLLRELRGWHLEYAPADDRQARARIMEVVEQKGSVGLQTLFSILQGEGIASSAFWQAVQRLLAKRSVVLEGPTGVVNIPPELLTDDHKLRKPTEGAPPLPPEEEEVEVDTETCGSPDLLLSLLEERLLDEARIVQVVVTAEPNDPKVDPLFGHDWRGPEVRPSHTLTLRFDVPTTKVALLNHLQAIKERLTGMKLQCNVKARVRRYVY